MPGKPEGQEAASPAVRVPDGKQVAAGAGRQVAHRSPPPAAVLPGRRGTAAEEQAAGLPAARAAEQRVPEIKGRIAAELAVTAEPDIPGEAAPNPAIAPPLSESPTEAPAIGLQTQGTASFLASKEAATAPPDGIPISVLATNSLPSMAVPWPPLETSARKSSKTGVEQVPPLGPTDQETTGPVPSEAGQAHDLPVTARLSDRPKFPEVRSARGTVPQLDTVSDSSSTTGDNVGPADAKMRILALGTPDRGEVAFEVQVQAMAIRPAAPPVEMARLATPAKITAADEPGATRPQVPQVAPAATGQAPAGSGDGDGAAAGHERKQGEANRAYRSTPDPDSPAEGMTNVPAAKTAPQWAPSGALRQEGPLAQMAPPDTQPARIEEAAKVEPKPEIQPAPAREIKLEVTGAEGRVEVRISDRGGEVRVAVRTPDHQLAGTLRDNLPELTTRLAESGLRSEIWRPAVSSAGDGRHPAEMPAGNLAQDADSQSRGHGNAQGDTQERHPHDFQELQQTHKEIRKDFAWLMSSLR